MKYNNMFIGSRLMETITSGLYDGNLNCIREYIQNSIDAKANNIEIFFDNGMSDLIIKDDGSGMDKCELENSLGIGTSSKSDEDIGWRGIGIWSGVPVCKRIVVITKKKNDKKYRIEINNDIMRQEHLSNKPILDILSISTGEIEELPSGKEESIKEDHFTVVRLESILPTQRYVFDSKEIANYLSREIPLPFNKKSFSFASDIDQWLEEKGVVFPSVAIKFNGIKLYRPPFRSDIFLDKIIKKEFYIKNDLIAVGWFLTGIANEKLKGANCGIYFKKKGFTIGDANLVLRQFTGTYHPWQYGEIHIISRDLRENAARNNFEYNNGNVGLFLKSVGDFIRHLEQLNRYKSQKTSPKQFEKIKENLKNKDYLSMDENLLSIKERSARPVSFTSEPSIQVMKAVIDSEFDRYQIELNTIKNKIHNINLNDIEILDTIRDSNTPDKYNVLNGLDNTAKSKIKNNPHSSNKPSNHLIQVNADMLNDMVVLEGTSKTDPFDETNKQNLNLSMKLILNNVCPKMKSSLTRITKKGLEFPVMSITDPMRDLLKERTGLDENEIIRLSQAAYGWEKVIAASKPPLLLFDPTKDKTKENKHLNRNLRLGVMIYTIHDLFVNLYKHELGKDSLQWFEDSSKEEKDTLNAEMILIVDFICRLIEKSKNRES